MRAMILAAGRGERLQPLTDTTPKPMLPVGGRPLVEHQIGWLKAAGITHIVINLHHLGEQIEAHLGDGRRFGVHIRYSREAERLETGGGIVKALPLLGKKPFLILNGDIFTSYPFPRIGPLPDWADIHMVVTPRPAHRQQGDFDLDGRRVRARGDGYVYCGIALLRPEVFAGDRPVPFSLLERFLRAMEAGRLSAEVWEGLWIDIGSPDQLRRANRAAGPEAGARGKNDGQTPDSSGSGT